MADEHRDQDDQALGQGPQDQSPQEEPLEQAPVTDEIAELQAQVTEANEQALRSQADAQNAMRRAERDIEKAHKFGQEKLIRDLLPVVDNLERALESASAVADESAKAVSEGVALTLKSLQDALKKNSVEAVDPEGEPFNPELHEAMAMVESRDVEPNTVLTVYQKGYTLHDRLVRPARVVVSKAPAEA